MSRPPGMPRALLNDEVRVAFLARTSTEDQQDPASRRVRTLRHPGSPSGSSNEPTVPLFASNEPLTLSGSRAQRVLQRRINQSIAEYEVLNTLEQSWGELCTYVR